MLIPLTKNFSATVDSSDYEYLMQWKWYAQLSCNTVYAARKARVVGKKYQIFYMHRVINRTPGGIFTDHIDGNGLNNTRINLRNATALQNAMNKSPQKDTLSKYKGVCWDSGGKLRKKWIASIRVNGKLKNLGRFLTEEEAFEAYQLNAKKYFGEFRKLLTGEK